MLPAGRLASPGPGIGPVRRGAALRRRPRCALRRASPCTVRVNGECCTAHHHAAIYATYLRPDKVHTSYVAGIVSMDSAATALPAPARQRGSGPRLLWRRAAGNRARHPAGLAATFNSGFKIAQSGGGFYLNGTRRRRAARGAATSAATALLAIGLVGAAWPADDRLRGRGGGRTCGRSSSTVRSRCRSTNVSSRGATSRRRLLRLAPPGIGITRDGRIIFVYGPALDVRTLAVAPGRLRDGSAARHQPRVDQLHVLLAAAIPVTRRLMAPRWPDGVSRAVLLRQWPRLHGGLRAVTALPPRRRLPFGTVSRAPKPEGSDLLPFRDC